MPADVLPWFENLERGIGAKRQERRVTDFRCTFGDLEPTTANTEEHFGPLLTRTGEILPGRQDVVWINQATASDFAYRIAELDLVSTRTGFRERRALPGVRRHAGQLRHEHPKNGLRTFEQRCRDRERIGPARELVDPNDVAAVDDALGPLAGVDELLMRLFLLVGQVTAERNLGGDDTDGERVNVVAAVPRRIRSQPRMDRHPAADRMPLQRFSVKERWVDFDHGRRPPWNICRRTSGAG
ncbi:hypothetical protein [Pseudomonas aeruginosa]|uniref:hypothetical protein n=1 Tax=Pseudomonas aeruginosa TaxID=287 RepID=UPI001EE009C6|nr:hypothetical protein [Pseudomonas aeruginosa]